MKVVASTKLTRAQRAMDSSRKYGETSGKVFENAETKPLEAEGKKTLYIVCSSDKGLCGGVHSGLSRFMRRTALAPGQPPADLVLIGEKSRAQLSRTNPRDVVLTFAGVGKDIPTFADAQAIADQILRLETDYSDIKIVYNKFINATSYEPTIVLPTPPTSPPSRSTRSSSPTCASTPSPTPSTGPSPRATPARSPPASRPWM